MFLFFFLSQRYFCSKTYVFQSIKAGGQSDKLLEIRAHTEFLIVYILVPEKKTLQSAGLRQCCRLRPYARAFELGREKKVIRYLGELSGSLPSNARKKNVFDSC